MVICADGHIQGVGLVEKNVVSSRVFLERMSIFGEFINGAFFSLLVNVQKKMKTDEIKCANAVSSFELVSASISEVNNISTSIKQSALRVN